MVGLMAKKLDELVAELVAMSGPVVRPGEPAEEWRAAREKWERHVKGLCGQIFTQGMGAGWDKYHNALAEYVGEHRP